MSKIEKPKYFCKKGGKNLGFMCRDPFSDILGQGFFMDVGKIGPPALSPFEIYIIFQFKEPLCKKIEIVFYSKIICTISEYVWSNY
jgi:hypothetical protein